MNELFDWCVWVLEEMARITGMTYEEVNIWVFVIIHPLLTLLFLYTTFYYRKRYRQLTRNNG